MAREVVECDRDIEKNVLMALHHLGRARKYMGSFSPSGIDAVDTAISRIAEWAGDLSTDTECNGL